MTTFYANAKTANGKDAVITLTSTQYNKAVIEAEQETKSKGMTLEAVRVFQNHKKEPGILSKGNIVPEFPQQQKRKKK